MSFSKYERGKFIKERMMDLMLNKAPLEQDGGYKIFDETWQMISEVSTAGNPKTKRCANFPLYKEALASWQEAREARMKRFSESRSL